MIKRIRDGYGKTYAVQIGPLVVYVDRRKPSSLRHGGMMITWRGRRMLARHRGWRISLAALALLGMLALSGCCSTTRCYIARAQTGLELGDPIAIKSIGAVCRPEVAKCTGDPEKCAAYTKCRTALLAYKQIRKAVGDGLVNLNRILATLGVK